MEPFGIGKSLKLGVLLGAAWGLIFLGCAINVPRVNNALGLAIAIFVLVLIIVFGASMWVPDFMRMADVDKLGGGTGEQYEEVEEEEPND